MNNWKYRVFIAGFLSLFSTLNLFAQDEDGIVCDSLFLVKVNDLITKNAEKKKDGVAYFIEVSNTWNSGYYNYNQQRQICEISHLLLDARKATFEVYKFYLNTLISFSKRVEHRKNFDVFHNLLLTYCGQSDVTLSKIANYILSIKKLIEQRLLFDAPLTKWTTSTNDFLLTLNAEDKLTVIIPLSTLTCYAQKDSIQIFETSGFYDMSKFEFSGVGGKVTWERSGFSADSVYATFDKFVFELTRSLLEVDTATFYNYNYFDEPLHGALRYQAAEIASPSTSRFPKFESFQNRFKIDGLYNQVDYIGGYVQHGSQFIGSGTSKEPAILDFWREQQVVENGDTIIKNIVFMRSKSESYTFTQDKAFSNDAEISIYLDQDSIYHAGLNMQYFVASREINLIRNNDPSNMSRSPYFNSYHMVEMNAEVLRWNMTESRMCFTRLTGSEISEASFESYNYFASDRFYKLQGISMKHPLYDVREFLVKQDLDQFSAEELARHMGYSDVKIHQFLILLSFEGYVYYDRDTRTAQVRQKMYDYLMAATREKDYDVIAITSRISGDKENAILDLKNLDLQIKGVPNFMFSKENRVIATPWDNQVTLSKNRQINFNGELRAGLYNFYGNNFSFDYEGFKIDMENVDSMVVESFKEFDMAGNHVFEKVKSAIENITGTILIDNPKNKSGTYGIARFPIFESYENSFVYYDNPSIHGGVYDRDSVYFEIDPYKIDSLNAPMAEKLKLDGTFYSGNIFPVFKEVLLIQKDLSLGFEYRIEEEGMTTYGNYGKSQGIISVSNQGVKVRGDLNYLKTTTWSNDFTYFLDSMNTLSQRFLNRTSSKPPLPLMEGKNIKIHWYPYEDQMVGLTTSAPIDMFNAQASLSGRFVVQPKDIVGSGSMAMERSTVKSQNFTYTDHSLAAQKSSWSLASIDNSGIAIKTDNVNGEIDFTTRKGRFKSATPDNVLYFPVNQYMAYADVVGWNIDDETLNISTEAVHSFYNQMHKVESQATTENPAGGLFISTHTAQDSLNFISSNTDINLKNNIISSHEVEFVNVADATIYPGDKEITIEPQARHRTISQVRIVASRESKYHEFYDAIINITGRKFYSGSGSYDYVDVDNKRQKIRFDVISVNKENTSTYATGEVSMNQSFTLHPAFGYMGKVMLFANNEYLLFEGSTKLLNLPTQFAQNWVKFKSEIAPKNVLIPVNEENFSVNEKSLKHGLITNMDSIETYSTFFSETTKPNYHNYSAVPGFVKFERETEKYEVGTIQKLKDLKSSDNYMTLNTKSGESFNQGIINMARDLGLVDLKTRGALINSLERKEIIADLFVTLNFFFNEPNLEYMADTINKLQSLDPVSTLGLNYQHGMTDLIGKEQTLKLIEEQKLFGIPKNIPEGFKNTMVFTNLIMKWDAVDQAWKSFGKIGIGNILDKTVNKYVNGSVEFRYVKTSLEMIIYLEPNPNFWFFFKYTKNSMLSVSSDPAYNGMIEDLKTRQRKLKSDRGKYAYYLTYPRVKDESLFYFNGGTKEDFKKNNNPNKQGKRAKEEVENPIKPINQNPDSIKTDSVVNPAEIDPIEQGNEPTNPEKTKQPEKTNNQDSNDGNAQGIKEEE
ncbi:MAG: hypothetical protein RBR35_12015 [Salinivirgaceae bacterium]|nr:hypothetical protein [Salinivirgaceae bacterium]